MLTQPFNTGALLTDNGGGVVSIINPESVDVYITRAIIEPTVKSTGASTVDLGVGSSGTTRYDNLIDGFDLGAATPAPSDNIRAPGSNGLAGVVWKKGEYLTLSRSTGAVAGAAGRIHVEYTPLQAATHPA